VLCDPETAQPIFVRWQYGTDGVVVGTSAFTSTGTPYGGSLAALVSCEEATSLDPVVETEVQDLTTLTDDTETEILAAGASGVFRHLQSIIISNTTETPVEVLIRDSLGGTVRLSFFVPAQDTRGAVFQYTKPFRQITAANAWTAELSTSINGVKIAVQAVEGV
jgi:hypothetical protein